MTSVVLNQLICLYQFWSVTGWLLMCDFPFVRVGGEVGAAMVGWTITVEARMQGSLIDGNDHTRWFDIYIESAWVKDTFQKIRWEGTGPQAAW